MRKPISWFLTSLGCLIATQSQAETMRDLEYSLPSQEKEWKIEREFDEENYKMTIYIPSDENMTNWTESFAVIVANNAPAYKQEDLKNFNSSIEKLFPGKEINHKIIQSDEKGALIEWWTKDQQAKEDFHSWLRVVNRDKGTAVLEYMTKQIDKVDQARQTWQPALSKAKLVEKP